jgi:hypothetical protein
MFSRDRHPMHTVSVLSCPAGCPLRINPADGTQAVNYAVPTRSLEDRLLWLVQYCVGEWWLCRSGLAPVSLQVTAPGWHVWPACAAALGELLSVPLVPPSCPAAQGKPAPAKWRPTQSCRPGHARRPGLPPLHHSPGHVRRGGCCHPAHLHCYCCAVGALMPLLSTLPIAAAAALALLFC